MMDALAVQCSVPFMIQSIIFSTSSRTQTSGDALRTGSSNKIIAVGTSPIKANTDSFIDDCQQFIPLSTPQIPCVRAKDF